MAMYLGAGSFQQFTTGTVAYLSGGLIYAYVAGTSTPKNTYPTITDAIAGTNANTWPVVLNARGEANIAISGATDVVIKDSLGNTIKSIDGLDQAAGDVFDSSGNILLHYIPVTSAVNAISVANAASGNSPEIAAYGAATNIGLKIGSKGSSSLDLDGGATGVINLGTTSTGQINLKRNTAVTGTLSISSTLGVTGAATLSSTLGVTGAATLSSTLGVTGATTLSSTLGVIGIATFSNQIVVSDTTKAFALVPAGVIWPFGGTAAPTGFLLCDGTAVSRTTYATLFTAIGTAWGAGDGSTTFNLPDFRRRTFVGSGGSGTGTLASTVGATGGTETVTLASANMPSTVATNSNSSWTGATPTQGGGASINVLTYSGGTIGVGSGTAVNNLQPSNVCLAIIRAY